MSAAQQAHGFALTIEDWLYQQAQACAPDVRVTMLSMFRACREISLKIRTATCDKLSCFNTDDTCKSKATTKLHAKFAYLVK